TMVMVVSKINSALYVDAAATRSGILGTFLQYQVVFPQPLTASDASGCGGQEPRPKPDSFAAKPVHEELIHQWLMLENDSIRDKLYENSHFFFDLSFKAL